MLFINFDQLRFFAQAGFEIQLPCAAFAATTAAFAAEEKSAAAPTDPQIAMIAVTADTIDIDAGKLAGEKTTNPKVKEFETLL